MSLRDSHSAKGRRGHPSSRNSPPSGGVSPDPSRVDGRVGTVEHAQQLHCHHVHSTGARLLLSRDPREVSTRVSGSAGASPSRSKRTPGLSLDGARVCSSIARADSRSPVADVSQDPSCPLLKRTRSHKFNACDRLIFSPPTNGRSESSEKPLYAVIPVIAGNE